MRYEGIIEEYENLREKCYRAIKRGDRKLLGSDYWLRAAIQETDIQMIVHANGIECYGSCYTMQTMDTEHFSILIPLSELESND
ncbi:hypothetical protein SEA_MILDRED21_97 [Streptomyces phage Mildred21]|uniref:Uncharacterized protein n=1 Tax=Streptomyces phage Mildred21 TaxID=2023959 RepID=A0A222YU50_9CAUD|nr:hypothetical protein FDI35_gp174 [Streptomyces phage Mildred21]ASR75504.1 hypothetical protein SEA_MILDRED21_97 [Streptomyces phage Mildred21]